MGGPADLLEERSRVTRYIKRHITRQSGPEEDSVDAEELEGSGDRICKRWANICASYIYILHRTCGGWIFVVF